MSSSPSRRNRSSELSRKNSIRGERNNENSRSNDSNKNSVHVSDDSDFNTRGHGPPKIEGMVSLKVDNITQRTGVNLLKKVFGKFGDLGDIYVPRYPDTFASRGFAFVRYYRKRDAEDAMHAMNGERLDGRILSIQMARYARPSPNKLSDKHLSSKRTHYHSDFRRNGTIRYRRTSYNDRAFSRRKRSRSRSRDRRKYNSRQSARSRSRSRSRTRSRSASRSRSRSRTRSRSRSKGRTSKRRTRYRSRTKSKSRTRSRSRNRSQSRNSSKSVSQEKKIKTEDISEKACNLTEQKDRFVTNAKSEENTEKTHLESRHRDSRSKSHSNSR